MKKGADDCHYELDFEGSEACYLLGPEILSNVIYILPLWGGIQLAIGLLLTFLGAKYLF